MLGSAAMAAFMTSRIGAELGGGGQPVSGEGPAPDLPSFLEAPFSAALAQSLLLPAFIALFGVVGAIFLRGGDRGDVMPDHPLAATPTGVALAAKPTISSSVAPGIRRRVQPVVHCSTRTIAGSRTAVAINTRVNGSMAA